MQQNEVRLQPPRDGFHDLSYPFGLFRSLGITEDQRNVPALCRLCGHSMVL